MDVDRGDTRSKSDRLSSCGSGGKLWIKSGNLHSNTDDDFFKIQCDDGRGKLTVSTTGNTDTVGTLYYGNGAIRDTDDDDGPGSNFSIEANDLVGTYYIGVEPHSTSNGGDYELNVRWTPYDTCGSYTCADTVLSGNVYPRFLTNNDIDWFRFNPGSGGGCINLTVYSSLESGLTGSFDPDPYAELQDGNGGTVLLQNDDASLSTLHFRLHGKVKRHGYWYFVKVREYEPGPYRLHVTSTSAATCSGSLN